MFKKKKSTSELVRDSLGILEMLFPGLGESHDVAQVDEVDDSSEHSEVLSPFALIQLGQYSVQTA